MVHVPYRGTAQSVVDLMEGRIELLMGTIAPSLAHIRDGKMRALATTGAKRNAQLPDIPTVAESGLAGYEAGLWSAFVLPAKAPAAVVARINREVVAVVNAPETQRGTGQAGRRGGNQHARATRCADPQRRGALGRDHPGGRDRRASKRPWSEGMSVEAVADIHVEDVEYLRHPSGPLLARIYRPKEGRPRAALVSMHGGRWTRETRLTNTVIDEALARDGVLVMALDIRMPPVAGYPDCLADINYAIRWLKVYARMLGVRR